MPSELMAFLITAIKVPAPANTKVVLEELQRAINNHKNAHPHRAMIVAGDFHYTDLVKMVACSGSALSDTMSQWITILNEGTTDDGERERAKVRLPCWCPCLAKERFPQARITKHFIAITRSINNNK